LFISPGKGGGGGGKRLESQDEQNNCRSQSDFDAGTQEAVFCLKANAEKVYKLQIVTMLLLKSP
jgi:hypothetical protein